MDFNMYLSENDCWYLFLLYLNHNHHLLLLLLNAFPFHFPFPLLYYSLYYTQCLRSSFVHFCYRLLQFFFVSRDRVFSLWLYANEVFFRARIVRADCYSDGDMVTSHRCQMFYSFPCYVIVPLSY